MKRYILLAILCLFMAALMAQTGLFDLSFGQSTAEAHAALLEKGFLETDRDDLSVIYENAKIPGLTELEVWDVFDDGTISGWTARYYMTYAPGLVQKMLSELSAMHKGEPERNESTNEWIWDLGSTYRLSMKIPVNDEESLTVDYWDTEEDLYWLDLMGW
ncbi:MAG: hypothetical protein PHG34_06710 [Candidatus Cloacimonetes bacterium]|nr:hypothetical protein [Candidatus Cloacimonadota bacterium]